MLASMNLGTPLSCASVLCRGALMSGRHEFKNGITHTIGGRERMTLTTHTLPQMLKSAGFKDVTNAGSLGRMPAP